MNYVIAILLLGILLSNLRLEGAINDITRQLDYLNGAVLDFANAMKRSESDASAEKLSYR